MNTNIQITLDEEQRRRISRHMFGSNKPVTRKELTGLVNMVVEHLMGGNHPGCHGDYRVGQDEAERDCHTCDHRSTCMEKTDERMLDLQTLQPTRTDQHANLHVQRVSVRTGPGACPPGADPKRWHDASYRRGWDAVARTRRGV